jgi:hypothetical protein
VTDPRYQAAETAGLMENGKWEMAKRSRFSHFPFPISHFPLQDAFFSILL